MGTTRKILLAICAVGITSCSFLPDFMKPKESSDVSQWLDEKDKILVCATTQIVADTVKRIGGDSVAVITLIGNQLDPHSYTIVKGDQEKLSSADIVFANGLGLEHSGSMQKALKRLKNVVYLSDALSPGEIIKINESPDPHFWMDLALWSKTTRVIAKAFSEADPVHKEEYSEAAMDATNEYLDISKAILDSMQSIPSRKRYLVTSHDAFNYYGRAYLAEDGKWKDRVIAIQGLAPDEQISHEEIRRVVEYIIKHDVDVIFAEKNLSNDSLKKVIDSCNRKGKKVALSKGELYGDTLGNKTYVGMMQSNANVINKSLGGNKVQLGGAPIPGGIGGKAGNSNGTGDSSDAKGKGAGSDSKGTGDSSKSNGTDEGSNANEPGCGCY